MTTAYDDWKFHTVYHTIFNYCVTDLSSFYLDVLKDRLYSDATDSVSRRSAQTVLAAILFDLVRMVAPILSFTAEEVWQFAPEDLRGEAISVHLAGWPSADVPAEDAAALRDSYGVVMEVREAVTKALEDARNDDIVGKSQEARVTITAPADTLTVLESSGCRGRRGHDDRLGRRRSPRAMSWRSRSCLPRARSVRGAGTIASSVWMRITPRSVGDVPRF